MTTSTTTTETHNGVTFTISTTTTTRRRQAAMPRSEAEWDEIRKRRDAFRCLNGDRDDGAERERQRRMTAWVRRRARVARPAAHLAPSREASGRARHHRAPRRHRATTRRTSGRRAGGGSDLPGPDPPGIERAPREGALSKHDNDAQRVAESARCLNVAGSARAWARRAGAVERRRDRGRP